MSGDVVRYDVRDRIAVVTLNRPEQLNAITREMSDRYNDALDRAAADPEVRAVVVTGAGRGFCAGADLHALNAGMQGGERVTQRERAPMQMEPAVPKPVIAAINGPCVGLGLVRALFCDVRFAVPGAKFSTAFVRRGLVAEWGLSWLMPRLVGMARSLDLLMSGRVFLSEEAFELGVVNRVVDGDVVEAALDYARDLVTWCSPAALRDIKAQVWQDASGSLAESWARAEPLMEASFLRPDVIEGIASHLEKREPRFPPLS